MSWLYTVSWKLSSVSSITYSATDSPLQQDSRHSTSARKTISSGFQPSSTGFLQIFSFNRVKPDTLRGPIKSRQVGVWLAGFRMEHLKTFLSQCKSKRDFVQTVEAKEVRIRERKIDSLLKLMLDKNYRYLSSYWESMSTKHGCPQQQWTINW